MDRSVLKQVGKRVLACLMVVGCVGCVEHMPPRSPSSSPTITKERMGLDDERQQENALRHYQLITDSLKDMNLPYAKYYAFAFDSLIDKSMWNFTTKFPEVRWVMDLISVCQLNDHLLIEVKDRHGRLLNDQGLVLYLVTRKFEVLDSSSILGSHYDTGRIEIGDFNSDGIDDIKYEVLRPVSSVNAGIHLTELYDYDEHNKLRMLFSFNDVEWDYTPVNEENYDSISREWSYSGRGRIKIIEKKWWVNGYAMRWEGEQETKIRVGITSKRYLWDKKIGQYIAN